MSSYCSMQQDLLPFQGCLIPHCMYTPILFTYSFVHGPLSCFHLFVILNSVAMNTGVQISLWAPALNSFGCIPRSRVDFYINYTYPQGSQVRQKALYLNLVMRLSSESRISGWCFMSSWGKGTLDETLVLLPGRSFHVHDSPETLFSLSGRSLHFHCFWH